MNQEFPALGSTRDGRSGSAKEVCLPVCPTELVGSWVMGSEGKERQHLGT